MSEHKLAVLLVRGRVGIKKDQLDTLNHLNLNRKHAFVVVPKNPHYEGMVAKVQNFVTYGTLDAKGAEALKKITPNGKTYHLHPPFGGYERKGIKKAFNQGGALGDRKEKINDLIVRMIP